MKKILFGIFAALLCACSMAATTVPSSLINWITPPSAPSQTAKSVFAAPNASAGAPTFRQLVASDIPTLAPLASASPTGTWSFSARPTFAGNAPWDSGNLSFASPPAIGGTTPAAGTFTTLLATNSKAIASTTNAQSLPNAAFTQITTFTASLNQGSNFTASTGNYVVPAAGTYAVRAAFTFNALAAAAVGEQIIVGVFVNGAAVQQSSPVTVWATTSAQNGVQGAFAIKCSASDVITIRVFHNLGSSLVLSGSSAGNWISIEQEP